jgi:hypothetical protein
MSSCRRKQRKQKKRKAGFGAYNKHHRLPRSRGGTDNPDNISIVRKRHHLIFNELFGSNPTAHEVAKILSDVWIDPRYEIIVRRKENNDGTIGSVQRSEGKRAAV